MVDIIHGLVMNVIDGDTFVMHVKRIGTNNKESYGEIERIRIAGIDTPELGSSAGQAAKSALERKLNGKEVKCYIQARDKYGRIVAEIEVL